MKILKQNFFLIVLFLLSIISIVPFLHSGIFPIHDDTQVTRVYEMKNSLEAGMFPVRWSENLGYGYGYPIFNFYSPLPYYIGGALNLLFADSLFATKLLFIIGIIGAAISMFYFVKRFFGEVPALVSSVVYLYFPYHAVNIYVRGALAELFAYAFFPLVFLSLFNIHYQKENGGFFKNNLKHIILGAFSIAAVVLSHNLSAFMLFMFLPIFMFISVLLSKQRKEKIIAYLLTFIFGILISSFYILPAIFEMKYTNVNSQIAGGSYYPDHFVCISQLWDSLWGFGGSTKGCLDGMSFRIGKINIILSFLAFILFLTSYKKIKEKFLIWLSFAFILLSIFMLLEQSIFIWKMVPSIDFLQFPWRFLNFVGFFMALVCGFFVYYFKNLLKKKLNILLATAIVLLIIIVNGKLFNPQLYLDRDSSFYTNKENIVWNISKISDEYMPINFKKPRQLSEVPQQKLSIIEGSGSVSGTTVTSNKLKTDISMESAGIVRANIAYFPAWKLFINGKEKNYIVKNNGLYADVPIGKTTLEFKFVQTQAEKTGNVFSTIGVLMLFFCIISSTRKTKTNEKTS